MPITARTKAGIRKQVQSEWLAGSLHSGKGGKVVPRSRPDQMWAIANSIARRKKKGKHHS